MTECENCGSYGEGMYVKMTIDDYDHDDKEVTLCVRCFVGKIKRDILDSMG